MIGHVPKLYAWSKCPAHLYIYSQNVSLFSSNLSYATMLIFMLNFTPRYLIFLTNEIISKKKEVPWESGFTLKGNGEERAGR